MAVNLKVPFNNISADGGYVSELGQIFSSLTNIGGNANPVGAPTLDQFLSTIGQGLITDNKFLMFMGVPSILTSSVKAPPPNYLPFLCKRVNLPGMGFETNQYRANGYGPVQETPIAPKFNRITANFYCDTTGMVVNYFNFWFNRIINNSLSTNNGYNSDGAYPYESYFKNEYAVNSQIVVYSQTNENVISYDMQLMFPIGIGDVTLDWGNKNQQFIFPVEFAYKACSGVANKEQVNNSATNNRGFGNSITQLGQVVTNLGQFQNFSKTVPDVVSAISSAFSIPKYIGV